MITDARARVDLIAALHLEALFKMGHLDLNNRDIQVTQDEVVVPHTREHNSVHLRDRLIFVQSLAVSAQGLTVKTDMAKAAKNSLPRAFSGRGIG